MFVKGTAFIARRALITERIGESAFDRFVEEVKDDIPTFATPILPSTQIPADDFLAFNDRVVARFFRDDARMHWTFGEKSADWAFSKGPYKAFFQSRDYRRFVASGQALWKAYYSDGDFHVDLSEDGHVVDVTLTSPVCHVHFEYSVMAYVKRGLELTGANVSHHQALRGFSLGHADVHYRFFIE